MPMQTHLTFDLLGQLNKVAGRRFRTETGMMIYHAMIVVLNDNQLM